MVGKLCPLVVLFQTSIVRQTFLLMLCHPSRSTSSQYCRDSARSLVAAYNDGALPCNCDASGSTGDACDPVGGQCPCREHVIGRQCTKCSTGYYGFPHCRREWTFYHFSVSIKKKLAFSPSHSLVSLCSVRVRPPTVRRGDGELHLPRADSQASLRCVRGSDVQLPPSAGLRGLRLLPQRHQRRRKARVWPHHRTVQVCVRGHLLHTKAVLVISFWRGIFQANQAGLSPCSLWLLFIQQ